MIHKACGVFEKLWAHMRTLFSGSLLNLSRSLEGFGAFALNAQEDSSFRPIVALAHLSCRGFLS